jgi:predicted nucleotidyltransferase
MRMSRTKVISFENITNILKEHKDDLKAKCGVEEIGVFGSYVRGEQKGRSDIDILVELRPDARIGLLGFINMENYLSELLGIKVDLVEKAALKPRIGKRILRQVVRL